MRGWRLALIAVVTAFLLWTLRTGRMAQPLYPIVEPAPSTDLGTHFDATRCGTVDCQVRWMGAPPVVAPISLFQSRVRPDGNRDLPNPNAPRVSPSGGIAEAVVTLHGIDPARSRPWTRPPVSVDCSLLNIHVQDEDRRGSIGVVRRGKDVEFVTHEKANHSVRGRGAATFNRMLFTPDQPGSQRISDSGVVELSSGSGFFWLHAYLIVSDHPYVGITDSEGRVTFENVPDGEYEVTCWKANWHVARIDRDPEWIQQAELYYRPPVERRQRVKIVAGQTTQTQFTLKTADFDTPKP